MKQSHNSSETFGIVTLLVWVKLHAKENTTEHKSRYSSIKWWVWALRSWDCEKGRGTREGSKKASQLTTHTHMHTLAFSVLRIYLDPEQLMGISGVFIQNLFQSRPKCVISFTAFVHEPELHTKKHRCFLSG